MSTKIKVELIENFLVVWNPAEGSELYKNAYYGKPVGIPKPKIPEFDVPLVLDLMEGLYLAEAEKIEIYENPDEVKVNLKKLRIKAKQLYDEFEEKYAVYRDLRDSGLIVTPGIKFGVDFAVYKYGPGVEHAPFMITVKKAGSEITATELVKNGRLATTVRKRFIIAVPDVASKETRYLMFKWFKA
jgi:tRNA-intron endonuclease, archaea type